MVSLKGLSGPRPCSAESKASVPQHAEVWACCGHQSFHIEVCWSGLHRQIGGRAIHLDTREKKTLCWDIEMWHTPGQEFQGYKKHVLRGITPAKHRNSGLGMISGKPPLPRKSKSTRQPPRS
eukprot:15013427-Alexandrium_andersonii.AAC.1